MPQRSVVRRWRWVAGMALAALLALVICSGAIPSATEPAAGESAGVIGAPVDHPIRLATFNIHSGVGSDGKRNLHRTADALNGFDIVGLNEVRGALLGDAQARTLGDQLQMMPLFAPTERRWWHDDFGNAALLRFAVRRWQRTPLSSSAGRGKRNILELEIPVGSTSLHVFVTHIDRQTDRAPQIGQVSAIFLASPSPAVLMGDFNTAGSDPILQKLRDETHAIDCLMQVLGSKLPKENIDWIFAKGVTVQDAGLIDSGASDHPLAWAQINLVGSGATTRP